MSPLLLQFADGDAFFPGAALAVAALALAPVWRGRLARPALAALALGGGLVAVCAAPPLPFWLNFVWGAALLAALALASLKATSGAAMAVRVGMTALFVVLTLGVCVSEAFQRVRPKLGAPAGGVVYVIGDSLSAGISAKETPWPEVMARRTGLRFVNLAQPGATARTALNKQLGKIPPGPNLVLVEIGGNDMLCGVAPRDFYANLDQLLGELRGRGCSVALFELPLPPFHNAFGRAQRGLAARHGVVLIPKGVLSDVLGIEGGTLDGIHLAQRGHDALAEELGRLLRP